jgi:hypothetical protein
MRGEQNWWTAKAITYEYLLYISFSSSKKSLWLLRYFTKTSKSLILSTIPWRSYWHEYRTSSSARISC